MHSFKDRLQWARDRKFPGQKPTDVARDAGWPISTYLGHENGDRPGARLKTIKKYARKFGIRWEWLLDGTGTPDSPETTAPVLGEVRAGDQPIHYVDNDAPLDEAELPPGAPANIAGVIVRGDSMFPRYLDGEVAFYTQEQLPPSECIGRECVVRLQDGRMMIKIIQPGSRKNRFNLGSYNATVMENQAVDWCAPIRWRGRVNHR